ncbi:pirin family protein [Flavicella sediminum]|uniref:pirin family protein n=1 Tax=Flavicella sediminum TaxID=2585141 RepID=UPI001123F07A|nr:pirin family protein [Flavicella sediminum]
MKTRSIQNKSKSNFVNMGPIRLRQPLPSFAINNVDPFILLHHYGPYEINAKSNPFDLGPHPHRGFEPITFLIQGEQLHRDSLGNESIVKSGDVQWTTAGNGIVHAEGPTKEFVKKGGLLEGIQLWLNLPASHKMMEPNYQHVKNEDFAAVTSQDLKTSLKIISGTYKGVKGKIETQTGVQTIWGNSLEGSEYFIEIPKKHDVLIYLIKGSVFVNEVEHLREEGDRMFTFKQDGEGINIKATADSEYLVLSGVPLKEKVVSHGPFVMNSQQEIQQAIQDYQKGKMGYLAE